MTPDCARPGCPAHDTKEQNTLAATGFFDEAHHRQAGSSSPSRVDPEQTWQVVGCAQGQGRSHAQEETEGMSAHAQDSVKG